MTLRSWDSDDVRRFGYISINGQRCLDTTPPHHKPGINTVIFDKKTGQLKDHQHFDTNQSMQDAEKLSEYLNFLPSGTVVLGVSVNKYGACMTKSLISTLRTVGVTSAFDDQFQRNIAFAVIVGRPNESIAKMAGSEENENLVLNVTLETDSQTKQAILSERL